MLSARRESGRRLAQLTQALSGTDAQPHPGVSLVHLLGVAQPWNDSTVRMAVGAAASPRWQVFGQRQPGGPNAERRGTAQRNGCPRGPPSEASDHVDLRGQQLLQHLGRVWAQVHQSGCTGGRHRPQRERLAGVSLPHNWPPRVEARLVQQGQRPKLCLGSTTWPHTG